MSAYDQTIATLNKLIEFNNDRAAGFEKAVDELNGNYSDLREIFQTCALQSRRYSRELAEIVNDGNAHLETDEVAVGTIKRFWDDIQSIFNSPSRASLLKEAERGEDTLKRTYEAALYKDLDSRAWNAINAQLQEIAQAHNRLRLLKEEANL